MLEGERKYKNIVLAMGITIGGDTEKSGKNTHLLVIICVRLLQNIGPLDLKNQNQPKKGNGYTICAKSVRDYWGMCLMLHMQSIYQ